MEIRTACPFDCPDGCGIIAETENGRLKSVRGDDTDPRTCGYLCRKMQHYEEMVNHPNRVLYPMKRVGPKGSGKFTRITWQEALNTITERWKSIIADYGPEAILPFSFAGTEGKLQFNIGTAFFNYMGASQINRVICSTVKSTAWKSIMGSSNGMDADRLSDCDTILVWSSNVSATQLHVIPYLKKAKENGARIILIDVYRNPGAIHATDVKLIKPGSDGALALGMIHIMERDGKTDKNFIRQCISGYEDFLVNLPKYTPEWTSMQTGLSVPEIEELASLYAAASRPGILLGYGLARRSNGGNNVRCICALAAVQGGWKYGYGIVGCSNNGGWINENKVIRPDFMTSNSRMVNMMQLGHALTSQELNPAIHSLYVYNSNPAVVDNDQNKVLEGLQREDLFTIVHERFLTDTAKYADILLPATFSTEHFDVYEAYGYNALRYGRKICEIPGECKSNCSVFSMLAKYMDYKDPFFAMTEEEHCMNLLTREELTQPVTDAEWSRLMEGYTVTRPLPVERTVFGTASSKIEFVNPNVTPVVLEHLPEKILSCKHDDSEQALSLTMAPSVHTLNSTFNSQKHLTDARGPLRLIIHETDASRLDIRNGEYVTASNEYGSVVFEAAVTDTIIPGCAVAEGVYTIDQCQSQRNANALTGEDLSDMGESTTVSGYRIRLHK